MKLVYLKCGGIILRPDNWIEKGEDDVVEFDVHCKMNKAWANEFLSMLKLMENNGNAGHSGYVAIYSDGDGDFRPNFETKFNFEEKSICHWNNSNSLEEVFHSFDGFYDAG